ncbi:hypothetical protein ACJJTC_006740 [Scirpophaga incertulas]
MSSFFLYMAYRAVYGVKVKDTSSLVVDSVDYGVYENYLPPNSHKTIACKYSNKNQKVEWLDPAGNSIPISSTKRISAQKHLAPMTRGERTSSLLLNFVDTQVDDTGVYKCQSGELSGTVSLCVIAPSDFVDTPVELTLDEGRSYTLSCEARGQPEPRLVWIRNGEEIVDDGNSTKYQVMTKFNKHGFESLLTVTSLTPEDSGIYTCQAIQQHAEMENCNLIREMNISVIVNYAPIFPDGNLKLIYGRNNQSIDLVCSANGYPLPTYRWLHSLDDDTVYEYPKGRISFLKDQNEAKLTIVANAMSFGQTYICEAHNEHGETMKIFQLLKLEKPVRPSEVSVSNFTDHHIELNLTWSEPALFPVEFLEIQYMPETSHKRVPDWKKAQISNVELEAIEDQAATVNLTNLEPKTDYLVRVRVNNELGSSLWSSPITASTAEEEEASTTTEGSDEAEPVAEDEETARRETMFFGIFFGGGILILTFICVLVLKFV